MKRINLFLLLLLSTLSFAQSWQSKDVVRIENTESSFHYTFYDSTTLYIQKQNVSYIVSLPNSNYIQVGYLYEGATSKIMSCTYNTLTQPILSSNSELVDTLNAWLNEPSSGGGGGGGSGTVTSVSVVTANGISGTVANATTTPAITLIADTISKFATRKQLLDSITSINSRVPIVTDSQSLSLAFSDSIRMSISRGNTISFAYAYDSVSTNTAGDSMITFKAGVRRAYEIVSGSSGSTFNGLKLVTTSRDLDSTDVGYVLVLFTDSLELTMPEIAPFKDNDNIAIASFADNCSIVMTFGEPELYLLGFAENRTQTIQMQYSAENGGFLLLNSGFIIDTDDSNKAKTAELYYYEKIKKSPIKGTFSEPSAVAQTDFVVTIPTQIDTTYEVTIQGKNPLSAVLYYVADADKTTTSFTVKTGAGLTGAVEFGYILKP